MHEMPIVLNVIESMEKYAEQHQIPEIHAVVMEIGEVSGVMAKYFRSCWQPAIEQSKYLKNAELDIIEIPGIVKCQKCNTEFNIVQHNAICPQCGSEKWTLVSGRDIMIKEILVN